MLDPAFNLGVQAFTVASHATVVIAILFLFHVCAQMTATAQGFVLVAQSYYVRLAFFAVLSIFMIEHYYYIGARLLSPYGVNLWAAHPAPEVLSASTALTIFNLSASIRLALGGHDRRAMRDVSVHLVLLVAIWLAVAAILY